MRIIECQQKDETWWKYRRGMPTASEFSRIITPVRGQPSEQATALIDELIAQKFSRYWPPSDAELFMTQAMQHGVRHEDDARNWYEMTRNVDVRQVGFCISDCGRYGASPDGLVGDDGAIEIKCPTETTQVRYLREGVLPSEYKCQCHGVLLVTKRNWVDFISWSDNDNIPTFVIRVEPDEFTLKLKDCLESEGGFLDKYTSALEKIERLR